MVEQINTSSYTQGDQPPVTVEERASQDGPLATDKESQQVEPKPEVANEKSREIHASDLRNSKENAKSKEKEEPASTAVSEDKPF